MAVGYGALSENTLSSRNVAIGNLALLNHNTTAGNGYNTAMGYNAGQGITSGTNNTIVGGLAGDPMTNARFNTVVGVSALSASCGDSNTAIGYAALAGTTGQTNIAIGTNAGDALISGQNNIIIGVNADAASDSGVNAIVLGTNITADSNDFSFGKASNVVTNDFDTDANWSRSSDLRLKKNIADSTLGLSFINALRPVKYNWKPSHELDSSDAQLAHLYKENPEDNEMNTEATMYNFIAQEVKAALDAAGVSDFSGWSEDHKGVQQVSREMFIMPLVKAVQELTARVEALES